MRYVHDPLCALMKDERCHGIGGTGQGHYLDRPECRNCGTKCDCARILEIRLAVTPSTDAVVAALTAYIDHTTKLIALARREAEDPDNNEYGQALASSALLRYQSRLRDLKMIAEGKTP